jgi:endo-beta-N-acetylglucosaminidase D
MIRTKIFIVFSLLCLVAGRASAQLPGQPYSSYWFPNELLGWTPAADPDAAFNRSNVQLADRFEGDTQANPHAHPGEADISALSIMYPSTSGNPSQGANVFDVYAFNYWQYIDVLVLWGGSAGEGLILSPSADVIDAGHRNGIPVYGTIFFPPVVYGGQIQWVWDLVQESGGTYPVADKLIEVAEYYGFDGWFINQETAGGTVALAEEMRDFMLYIQDSSDIRIMWYDAMIETGGIAWQNALNANNDWFFEYLGETVSDEMFLNFWWSANGLLISANNAISLGRSPFELHSGVDVQANGYNTSVNWDGVFPEDTVHITSLGFYCPNWTYSSSSSHEQFYQNANRFWVGENRDPGNTATSHPWKGLAHYVPAESAINDIPFVTCFNTGQGHVYSVEGIVMRIGDWNNRSLQDILPTWRWISQSPGVPLYPELDWDSAYFGGTCLKVSGDLSPGNSTDLYLYKTALDVSSATNLGLVYSTGTAGTPSGISLALEFSDNPGTYEYFDTGNTGSAGWNSWSTSIGAHSGRTISVIALRFESSTSIPGYTALIGQISVMNGTPGSPAPPSGLIVNEFHQVNDTLGTVRLKWTHSTDSVYAYYSFRVNADMTRTFLGGTPNNAYFVPEVVRENYEDSTVIEVRTLGQDFALSSPDTTVITWETTGFSRSATLFQLSLQPGCPNPFSTSAVIDYTIPCTSLVLLQVYGMDGRLVRTIVEEEMPAGAHSTVWVPDNECTGMYFLRLETVDGSRVEKCVLLRR